MKNSWKLGSLAGIEIFVHWSFAALIGWVALSYLSGGGGLLSAAFGICFLLAVFGCVFLHELGHALMAREFGIATRDITMLPVGGLARLERMPERPSQEIAVAVAGPAVNLVIAAMIFLGFFVTGGKAGWLAFNPVGGSFLAQLMWANLTIVVFNLLPAFPMDGGRVFRATLSVFMKRATATEIASSVGQVLALGLAVIGLFSNWMLMLVAGFIFFAARQENRFVQLQESMRGAIARDAMVGRFHVVPGNALLATVAREMIMTAQEDFPVVVDDRVVGMVSSHDVLQAMADGQRDKRVVDVVWCKIPRIESQDHLTDCLGRFQSEGWTSAAVFEAGQLVGIITLENMLSWLKLSPVLEISGSKVGAVS